MARRLLLGLLKPLAQIRDPLGLTGKTGIEPAERPPLLADALLKPRQLGLQAAGALYDAEGARWFRSTDYGDDKDRVVRRADGQTTYFASDIAYHLNKFERGFQRGHL